MQSDYPHTGSFTAPARSENTFWRRYARLPEAELYRSEAYPVYGAGCRRVVMWRERGAVNRNEGRHSRLRSKLNRPVRDTKGYAKSAAMLAYALALLAAGRTAKSHTSL